MGASFFIIIKERIFSDGSRKSLEENIKDLKIIQLSSV